MYRRRRENNLYLLETHANEDGAKYAKLDWEYFFASMYDFVFSHANRFIVGGAKLINERKYLEPESKSDVLNILVNSHLILSLTVV